MSGESTHTTERFGTLVRREDWEETERTRVEWALECASVSSFDNPQVWPENPTWWWWERFTSSLEYDYPDWMWERRAQLGFDEFDGWSA